MDKLGHVVGPTGCWPDRSLVRQVVGPTGRWSDRSLVLHVVGPTGRWSDRSLVRQIIGPTLQNVIESFELIVSNKQITMRAQ